jgi:hypothetical protein
MSASKFPTIASALLQQNQTELDKAAAKSKN